MKFLMKIEAIGRVPVETMWGKDAFVYLEWFKPENRELGLPMIALTDQFDKAQKFDDMKDLMETWRFAIGERPDGKPDRPLTAYTISTATLTTEVIHEQDPED